MWSRSSSGRSSDAKKLSEQFKMFYLSLVAAYAVSTSYVLRSCCTVCVLSHTFDSATVDAMSSRLQAQQATLAHHGDMLHAIYTSVTLSSATREQHAGHSMRFDETRAIQARLAPAAFPCTETNAGPPVTNPRLLPSTNSAGSTENNREADNGPHGFDVRAHAWLWPIYHWCLSH